MDPDANLKELRELAQRVLYSVDPDPHPQDVERLAELVEALDGWLSNKGFLPAAWRRGP